MDRHTERQTASQPDRYIDRSTAQLAERQADRSRGRHTDINVGRRTGRKITTAARKSTSHSKRHEQTNRHSRRRRLCPCYSCPYCHCYCYYCYWCGYILVLLLVLLPEALPNQQKPDAHAPRLLRGSSLVVLLRGAASQ